MNREINNLKNKLRNASGTGGSRASRRAELSSLLSANSSSKGLGEDGRDSPLVASSEDLSTRSGSPRYNSTFNDDSQTKRHPVGGLPSSRLLKGRGSVIPGDESTLGGEEEEEKEM